jgi:hypothetical protein
MVLRFPIVQQGGRTLLRFDPVDSNNRSDIHRVPPGVLVDLRAGRHVVLWCEGILQRQSASPCVKRIDGGVRTVLEMKVPQGESGLWFSWNLHDDSSEDPGYHLVATGIDTARSWPIWFDAAGAPSRTEVPVDAERAR